LLPSEIFQIIKERAQANYEKKNAAENYFLN